MPDLAPGPAPDDTRMPRWVKLLGIAAAVFLVAFAVLHIAGRGLGHHMPGMHGSPHGSDQP